MNILELGICIIIPVDCSPSSLFFTSKISKFKVFIFTTSPIIVPTTSLISILSSILKGFLIGKWIDDTQIEFTYQHLNQSLKNRLGRCCTTFSLEESKLIGHEKWQWLDTLEQGSSLIREI